MGWVESNTKIDPLAKEGLRIRMIHMDDQHGVDEGMEGTITKIDDLGTIHVNWDDGSQLGVIPQLDKYQLLPASDEQIDLDFFSEADFKLSSASKKNKMGKKINTNFKRELSKTRPRVKLESEKIVGGKSDGMSVKDLAKKHDVTVNNIKKELSVGTKIEMEHTDSKEKAKEIAMDHIEEFPDYYTNKKYGLKSSEKGLEKIHESKIPIKDEVGKILNTIKNAKPIHKQSLENMVNNLVNKYKNIKKDEDKFYQLIEKLRSKINDKFGVDETTTSGSAGSYNAPLFGKQTKIRKPKTKKKSDNTITKGSMSNPTGKIYSLNKESKMINVGDLLNELSSRSASKLRDGGSYDGDSWVGNKKDGWKRRKELAWEGGEISDILAKLDINWTDSDLSLSDKHIKKINEAKKESPIHTKKWERCVKDVEKKNKENKTDYNPYAVCQKSVGYKDSIKKPHRKKDKEEIEETTTFSSVFGGDFPVTPFMFAKKGQHTPAKKPIWKGGKIVQKTNRADLLGESILDEINKVKWVKGGKFVKIKDRCAKYNNKPWCSQGALDNPLELSDTVFENVKKISKKTGIPEKDILKKIELKLSGVNEHYVKH